MFRTKKIKTLCPSFTGVAEGHKVLKKSLIFISIVCLLFSLFCFSTSAKTVVNNANDFFGIVFTDLKLFKSSKGDFVSVLGNQSMNDVNNDFYYTMTSTETWVSGQLYRVVMSGTINKPYDGIYSGSFAVVGNPKLYNIIASSSSVYFANTDGSTTQCSLSLSGASNQDLICSFNSGSEKTPEYFCITFDFTNLKTISANSTIIDFSIMALNFQVMSDSEVIVESNNKLSNDITSNADKNADEIQANQDKNADEIQANQDKNTQNIINNQNQIVENEKNETQNSGNGSVDSLNSAVPDYSGSLLTSLSHLGSAIRHEYQTCNITIPAITIPKLDMSILGQQITIPEMALSSPQKFELCSYVYKIIPNKVIVVVQHILSLGLYIFCVKELYDTICYVMTLKGGNED